MQSTRRWLSVATIVAVFLSLLGPFASFEASAQDPANTGGLLIAVTDGAGSAVPGVCLSVTDSSGTSVPACDDDGDGVINVAGLAAGTATVAQSNLVDGYTNSMTGSVEIVAGSVATLSLVNAPVTATDEATEEPAATETETATEEAATETATEEATATEDVPATETSVVDPGTPENVPTEQAQAPADEATFEPAADDDRYVEVSCFFDPGASTSTYTVDVGPASPSDPNPDPNLIITITPYDQNYSPLPPDVVNQYGPTSYPNSLYRAMHVHVVWPDGVEADADAQCDTTKNGTSLTTQVYDQNNAMVLNGAQIDTVTQIYDTGTLTGGTANAGGTATYNLYKDDNCLSTPVYTETVTVTNGVVPPSSLVLPPGGEGLYNWQLVYSGDDNNNASTSQCGTERVVVGKTSPTLTTQAMTAAGALVPDDGSLPVDSSVYDTTSLIDETSDASGTVTYTLYNSADCSGAPVATYTKNVTDGVVENSDVAGPFPTPGTYNWVVSYSGDVKNNPTSSSCGDETFVISKNVSSSTTQMQNPDDSVFADGGTILIGGQIKDTVNIQGLTADAGGTVTYELFEGASACSGSPLATYGPYPVSGGIAPPSDLHTFDALGTYNWRVTYSGDSRNEGSTSVCGVEIVNVAKYSPGITTTMMAGNPPHVVGQHNYTEPGEDTWDTTQMTGGSPNVGGTVRYQLYLGYNCTGTPVYDSGDLPIVGGVIPDSGVVNPFDYPSNIFNWVVTYSGDGNNNPAGSSCGSEQFFSNTGPGTETTTTMYIGQPPVDGGDVVYPDAGPEAPLPYGSTLFDTAQIANGTADLGGTVDFYIYKIGENGNTADNPCVSGTLVSTANVVNAVADPSAPYTFATPGEYNWVAFYSGDDHNGPSASQCGSETVKIGGLAGTIATTMHKSDGTIIPDNSSVIVPESVYDSAAGTGFTADFSGTITYYLYDNQDCAGTPVFTSQQAITTPGTFPDSALAASATGFLDTPGMTYQWVAVYSGDALNQGATSVCGSETFYTQGQPTISTVVLDANEQPLPDDSLIVAGSDIHDSAVLTGASANAGGTVTYNLYRNDDNDCSGTPIFAPQVTVTNGVVPNSPPYATDYAGYYNWQAVYSGDQFNLPVTGTCGDETVITNGQTAVKSTEMFVGNVVLPDDGTVTEGTAVSDTAVVVGIADDAGGTIVYRLYKNDDCTGDPVFTDTQDVVNGKPGGSIPFTIGSYGTYNWQVTYYDELGTPSTPSVCGTETIQVTSPINRTINVSCRFYPSTGLSDFRFVVAKLDPNDPGEDPNLTIVATPYDNLLNPLPTQTYDWYDSWGPNPPYASAPAGALFQAQPWRRLVIDVTWPDGITGRAQAGCNTAQVASQISTVMQDEQGNTIANGTELQSGTPFRDTTILDGATAIITGALRYRLWNNADCSGTPVYDQTFQLDGALVPSDLYTPTASGTYSWIVTYGGDENNKPNASLCGDEWLTVAEPTPTATATETVTPTETATETVTPTETATETVTPTETATETVTPTETATETVTPTETATETVTPTETATETVTPTETATETVTPTETATETVTPTETATETVTPTETATETVTPTETATETVTPTETATETVTPTETATQTVTPTETATQTVTPTETATVTATVTVEPPTPSTTATTTPTGTATATPSATVTPGTTKTPQPPVPTVPPVKDFPNTGAGAQQSGSNALYTTLLMLIAAIAFVSSIVAIRFRARRNEDLKH